jgi:hypothetical protein
MWTVLVRFLICCHILPKSLLALTISSALTRSKMFAHLLTQECHLHSLLQRMVLQFRMTFGTLLISTNSILFNWGELAS